MLVLQEDLNTTSLGPHLYVKMIRPKFLEKECVHLSNGRYIVQHVECRRTYKYEHKSHIPTKMHNAWRNVLIKYDKQVHTRMKATPLST